MKRHVESILWITATGIGAIGLHLTLTKVYGVKVDTSLQVVLTAVLVAVTGFYAWSTERIARASIRQAEETKRQAEATVILAKEAEMQRLALWEPWIQPYVRYPEMTEAGLRTGHRYLEVLYPNTGKGDAYKVERMIINNRDTVYCEQAWEAGNHPNNEPSKTTSDGWPHIPAGQQQYWLISSDLMGAVDFLAVSLYKDRFDRTFISGYGFRLEPDGMRPTGAIAPRLFKEAR